MSGLPGKLLSDTRSSRMDDMIEFGAAGKALVIVGLLVNRDYRVQMSEIVEVSGIPKPSAHRLINFLVECGYDERHLVLTGYIIEKNLSLLAYQVLANNTGSGSKRLHMERLVERVNESVNVGAFISNHVVYRDRV